MQYIVSIGKGYSHASTAQNEALVISGQQGRWQLGVKRLLMVERGGSACVSHTWLSDSGCSGVKESSTVLQILSAFPHGRNVAAAVIRP